MRLHDGSWWFRGGSSWFVMFRHGSSWFVMVHIVVRDVSWWFVIVQGSFSLKFSRKYHVTHYLTNQESEIQHQISF